jgi:hypothetical protein
MSHEPKLKFKCVWVSPHSRRETWEHEAYFEDRGAALAWAKRRYPKCKCYVFQSSKTSKIHEQL